MKIGITGFAGSGKSTLFQALTGLRAPLTYGGEMRVGTVKVPDSRVDYLSKVYLPRKTTHAEIVFCDVPGEYGSTGKGLSRKSLQHIRDQDALCLVLRDFINPALKEKPNPCEDLYLFNCECIMADLELVEKKLERMKKEKTEPREIQLFETLKKYLEEEKPLRCLKDEEIHRNRLKGYSFLSEKPLLVIFNRSEEDALSDIPDEWKMALESAGAEGLGLSAGMEAEIAELEEEDQKMFLEDLGIEEPVLHRFVHASYSLLDRISFFTVGKDEVRAWTIKRGTGAREAAGKIHSDLERGFIRAEIIPFETFVKYGSENAVKEAGLLQVEGANYLIRDGELVHVRFNV